MRLQVYFALLLFPLASCKEEGVVDVIPKPAPVTVVSIQPSMVFAGTLMQIVVERESDSISLSGLYELNGTRRYAKSAHGDTLFIVFPYVLSFTGMTIFAYDERFDTSHSLELDFLPYPEVCTDSPICVRWSNIDSITARSSLYQWTATLSNDTVRLEMSLIYPDSYFYIYITFVDQGVGQLPQFLSYTTFSRPTFIRDTLQNGLIKIDQWNVQGTLSGVVFASELNNIRLWQSPPTYFYVELQ